MRDGGEPMEVIDVREPHEFEAGNLDGRLVPLATIMDHAKEIPRDRPVIIYCRSGARSAAAIHQLEKKHGLENLYNLKGGILAYAQAYDPDLPGM